MKVFASIVALLSTSAVAATKMHDIASPHFRAAIRYNAAEVTEGDACAAAATALFGCLGTEYTECFFGAYDGCDAISNKDFCAKIGACDPLLPADWEETCSAEIEAAESACEPSTVFQALLAEEETCDLEACEESETAVADTSAVAATEVTDIASPHFRAAIRYNTGEVADDDACIAAVVTLFGCLGEPYSKCFEGAYVGCESISNKDFCDKIEACEPLLPDDVEVKCKSEGEAVESACAGSAVFQALLTEEETCDLEACVTSESGLAIA